MACKHSPQWRLADCNEDGWHCAECDTKLGFRPDFDHEHTRDKVETILFFLVEADFLYVSNATEGESLTAYVAHQCRTSNNYTQQAIVHFIVAHDLASHNAYWRNEARKFFCPHGTRTRRDSKWVCDKCGHAEPDKGEDDLPLFAKAGAKP